MQVRLETFFFFRCSGQSALLLFHHGLVLSELRRNGSGYVRPELLALALVCELQFVAQILRVGADAFGSADAVLGGVADLQLELALFFNDRGELPNDFFEFYLEDVDVDEIFLTR